MHAPWRYAGYALWKRKPLQLTFFVTRRCDAGCPFCFYLRKRGAPGAAEPELTLEEIDRVAGSLGNLLWVAFSGGEVFLRPDLVEISEIFYRRNRPSFLLYSTNGLRPEAIRRTTEAILRRCPESVVTVKVSLDGIGEEHDRLRGVPGAFEKVMETHRRLAELPASHPNFELGINTVFCAGNQDRVEALLAHVRGLEGVRTHTVSMVRGDLEEEGVKRVDLGKYARAVRLMEEGLRSGSAARYRFRGARLKAAQDVLQRRLILRTLREGRRVLPCYAGRLNLVLTESGDVHACELLEEKMGRVRDCGYDVRRLLRTPRARRILRAIAAGACHCSHECYFITNILFNPRTYPALLAECLRLGGPGGGRGAGRAAPAAP